MNLQDIGVGALRSRYPYMFGGGDSRLEFCRGWMPAFAQACHEIDALLGSDKRGFHWTQTKEKFGWARFYARVDDLMRIVPGTEQGPGPVQFAERSFEDQKLMLAISDIRHRAKASTCTACMVCGRHAEQKYFGYYHLCYEHQPCCFESESALWKAVWVDD